MWYRCCCRRAGEEKFKLAILPGYRPTKHASFCRAEMPVSVMIQTITSYEISHCRWWAEKYKLIKEYHIRMLCLSSITMLFQKGKTEKHGSYFLITRYFYTAFYYTYTSTILYKYYMAYSLTYYGYCLCWLPLSTIFQHHLLLFLLFWSPVNGTVFSCYRASE